MRVLRKKKNVEGWDESGMEVGRLNRLKETIRASNRAWVLALIGIVLFGICLFAIVAQQEKLLRIDRAAPTHRSGGAYEDEAHQKFIDEFRDALGKRGIQAEAHFVNSGVINVVVPVEVSSDDLVYVSTTAARAILRRFRNAPYVYVYVRDTADPPHEKLAATTMWVDRRNDFEVVLARPKSEAPQAPRTESEE